MAYKDHERYMKSVLEFLVQTLNQTPLGEAYELVGVVYDDDEQSPRDQQLVSDYGFAYQPGRQWLYPADLEVQGKRVNDLLLSVPSTYRRHPRGSAEHIAGKQDFERRLHDTLVELKADIVVLDGLLVILDHGNGYLSLYGHNQTLLKEAGDVVKAGESISTVGNSGGQDTPALYFAIRQQGRPSDPAQWCHAQG